VLQALTPPSFSEARPAVNGILAPRAREETLAK